MPNIQCMLAAKTPDMTKLTFPLLVSKKLDGVRCLIVDGVAYSRNMKPIASRQVQSLFGRRELNGLDGELIAGLANAKNCYRRTTSSVMSAANPDDITFHVFDQWNSDEPFRNRARHIAEILRRLKNERVEWVEQKTITSIDELQDEEERALTQGYEGLMLRAANAPYKYGRSTAREGYLVKLKRFCDAEARVIGYEELMHNANEKTTNALGRTARSAHKTGKQAGAMLGALCVQCLTTGATFNVGSGFTAAEREALWAVRGKLEGRIIKYRYFPTGNKGKPRFPVFCGFRSPDDM